MKSTFFCDNCQHEVQGDQNSCPSCGINFAGVRCPKCSFQGEVQDFDQGCPSCHYQFNGLTLVPSLPPNNPTKKAKKRVIIYPWQLPIHDLLIIMLTIIVATIAILLFYIFYRA